MVCFLKNRVFLVSFLILAAHLESKAQAVFNTKSNGGGNINTAATWTRVSGADADGIPDANDDIVILTGDRVLVNGAASVNNITINSSTATPGRLIWSGAFTLTVAGNITFTYTSGTKPTFSLDNSGTLANGARLTFRGNFVNASNGIIEFWKTGATTGVTVDYGSASPTTQTILATSYGTFRLSGTGNKILPSSGNVKIYATSATCMQNATTGSITNTGSTIEYAGSGAQTIIGFNYNNLTSSGAGARTINATTVNIAGTYTPGTNTYTVTGSTVTFNGTTGSISGTGAVFNNLTINAGCTFTAPSTFRVNGNFSNSGTSFVHSNGMVVFGGTTTQNITGTSTTTFYGMTINASSIVRLLTNTNIEDVLTLGASSQFNINGRVFTLKSTATNTASIANLPATATFTGNVVLERYIPGPNTGWVLLGTPISGRTLADWIDDFTMSGFTGSSGYAGSGGFVSVNTYDETQPGDREAAAKYIAATNITNTISVGTGYWCYVGDGYYSTSNITVDVTGTITRNNQSVTVKYTNNNPAAPTENGWNLIANPYPSAISFSSLYTANSAKMQNYYGVYNADLGDYATYDNSTGTSSPALGSGGVGNNIPSSRGFYVQTLAAIAPSTTLSFTEAMKSATNNNTFVRMANPTLDNTNLFRLNVTDGTRNNDCVIRFTKNASNDLDQTDVPKIKTRTNAVADMLIYSSYNQKNYAINNMGELTKSIRIPISVKVGTTKQYKLSAIDINNVIAPQHCVRLFDKYTGTYTNIRKENYTCTIADTTTQARFELVIDLHANELVTINTLQPSCTQQYSAININTALTNYNYTLLANEDNTVIATENNVSGNTSVKNVPQGNYSVVVNNNSCVAVNEKQTVNSFLVPMLDFEVVQTINNQIVVHNTSKNIDTYMWDFGDGVTSTEINPIHTYANSGLHTITLTAINNSCKENASTITKSVSIDTPLAISTNTEDAVLNCYCTNKILTVMSSATQSSTAMVNVSTVLGQLLMSKSINSNQIDLSHLPEQPLLITIVDGDKKISKIIYNK